MRGEPHSASFSLFCCIISTHSPRAGRTCFAGVANFCYYHFNSLAPCGANRRTCVCVRCKAYFNSLAPCGANLLPHKSFLDVRKFQLTRPVRGEPTLLTLVRLPSIFQLTRPVRGEPFATGRGMPPSADFNSLAPCGANHVNTFAVRGVSLFQLTRPVRGEPIHFSISA